MVCGPTNFPMWHYSCRNWASVYRRVKSLSGVCVFFFFLEGRPQCNCSLLKADAPRFWLRLNRLWSSVCLFAWQLTGRGRFVITDRANAGDRMLKLNLPAWCDGASFFGYTIEAKFWCTNSHRFILKKKPGHIEWPPQYWPRIPRRARSHLCISSALPLTMAGPLIAPGLWSWREPASL